MLHYLVDDYLGGYNLPKIRTETNTYRLIFEDETSTVSEVEDNGHCPPSYSPDNIIALITVGHWHWILCSDRTEAKLFYPDRKSSVPADRFNAYLM